MNQHVIATLRHKDESRLGKSLSNWWASLPKEILTHPCNTLWMVSAGTREDHALAREGMQSLIDKGEFRLSSGISDMFSLEIRCASRISRGKRSTFASRARASTHPRRHHSRKFWQYHWSVPESDYLCQHWIPAEHQTTLRLVVYTSLEAELGETRGLKDIAKRNLRWIAQQMADLKALPVSSWSKNELWKH